MHGHYRLALSFLILILLTCTSCGQKRVSTPYESGHMIEASETSNASKNELVPIESPSWEVLSIDPNDFGIAYSNSEECATFPLDKLVAYCFGADGFYRECAGDELFRRFAEAPNTVLNYLALINDDDRKSEICDLIISYSYFYSDTYDLKGVLIEYNTIYTSGHVKDFVEQLLTKYDASVSCQSG